MLISNIFIVPTRYRVTCKNCISIQTLRLPYAQAQRPTRLAHREPLYANHGILLRQRVREAKHRLHKRSRSRTTSAVVLEKINECPRPPAAPPYHFGCPDHPRFAYSFFIPLGLAKRQHSPNTHSLLEMGAWVSALLLHKLLLPLPRDGMSALAVRTVLLTLKYRKKIDMKKRKR